MNIGTSTTPVAGVMAERWTRRDIQKTIICKDRRVGLDPRWVYGVVTKVLVSYFYQSSKGR